MRSRHPRYAKPQKHRHRVSGGSAAYASNPDRLVERVSELEKMRRQKKGPTYLRIGEPGRTKVLYRLEEVDAWTKNSTKPPA